jgi:hypothetical protein
MDRFDYQQQEAEEARQRAILLVLRRVSQGLADEGDALFLASNLGMSNEYRNHTKERVSV